MKTLFILTVVAGIAVASSPGTLRGEPGGFGNALLGTDWYYDTYAYDSGTVLSSIPASFSDYAVIDDYNGLNCFPEHYICWAVTTASNPSSLELLLVEDVSGAPSGSPFSQESYPCTVLNSGFTFGSYTVWITELDLPNEDWLFLESPVWLGSHRNDGNSWYPACGTTVSGSEGYRTVAAGWAWSPFSETIETGDLFKIIDGSPPPAINRNTWAGIKSEF